MRFYPKLREDLAYTAPELVIYKIYQITGINIDNVRDSNHLDSILSDLGVDSPYIYDSPYM